MNLKTFLHNLHFDINKVSPPDWEVDWEDAPLAYKLYRGLPSVPFSLEVPLVLEEQKTPMNPVYRHIGDFLWYVFGLTEMSQSVSSLDSAEQTADLIQSYRRFVPSGGGLYPNELYVYLKIEDLPAGVYHYDVAHHRLVLLRKGNFDSYISKALGSRCDVSACFGTVFVSTLFWKNFFKYNNFAYRLQGLDAGVLIGQLLEVAKRFGFASQVYFQFLDRALNHLLGLSEQEESVYAIIPLSINPISRFTNEKDITSKELCRQWKEKTFDHYVRSQRVKEHPMLTKINRSSMLETSSSFLEVTAKERRSVEGQVITLPQTERLPYDLASACRKRYSPNMDFVLEKVSQLQLALLLQEAAASFTYQNDMDGTPAKEGSRVSLYGCFYNVNGIPDGAYYYDSASHLLCQVNPGDHRHSLQYGMSLDNVNLFQVPLCLHIAGDRDHLINELGYRGYRIQQMEAGMLVQRLLLTAAAIGMGGHPILGFDAGMCDEIYKLDKQEKTTLIQIPIGPYRPRSWLRGSLFH
ncbi:SagB family peptide dehydrogenase [Alteribacillus bidgolensis]|uniref:SagB-type dehydrogenase domain-containing protein n=1 Tax=Alteribacillus bidgolensis TaxID=930129 RepID=A0A1G8QI30_9BACI|nr:SagB family peptide dehydrogenase [Alteribacillus bidgolensis]SDJ04321.1 SagB-type dehydrogenase domain-containing protein [Alteribacillus bidgolensis]